VLMSLSGKERVTDRPDRLASPFRCSRAVSLSLRSCAASGVLAFAGV
jgi:hypothetical protein